MGITMPRHDSFHHPLLSLLDTCSSSRSTSGRSLTLSTWHSPVAIVALALPLVCCPRIQNLHKVTTEEAQSNHEQRTRDLAHRKQEPRQRELRAKLLDRAIQRVHDTIIRCLVLVLLLRVDVRDVRRGDSGRVEIVEGQCGGTLRLVTGRLGDTVVPYRAGRSAPGTTKESLTVAVEDG